jgi:hypothetical protein
MIVPSANVINSKLYLSADFNAVWRIQTLLLQQWKYTE